MSPHGTQRSAASPRCGRGPWAWHAWRRTTTFFALGGDSIKGVVVLAALREAGFDLSFQELFAHPTVAEAAALARP
ncbi:acyl carrier protein [Streptomyces demainii]|uniref:acyl carrier protein n=1 Tax=Streptomyces demainii TaxID=588122 RepID=UPI0027D7DC2C|nr:acyl carrier protein [Streptomyces demainii]